MKKLLTFIFAAAVCTILAACGGEDNKAVEDTTEATTETATTTVASTTSATTATTVSVSTTTAAAASVTKAAEKTDSDSEEPENSEEEYENENIEEEYYEEEPIEEEPVQSGGSFSGDDMYFYYGGAGLTVDQSISGFPAASSVDSSPSCYYEGDDKIYHYGDFDVYTYPVGDDDYVQEITLLTGNVSTSKGLAVGMSLNDAIAMYGEGSDGGGLYCWYSGGTYMYVTTSGGTITSIGYVTQN